jgi:hypothetical protein
LEVHSLFQQLGPFGVVAFLVWYMINGLKTDLAESQKQQQAMTERVISALEGNSRAQTEGAGALNNVAVAIRDLAGDIHRYVIRDINEKDQRPR